MAAAPEDAQDRSYHGGAAGDGGVGAATATTAPVVLAGVGGADVERPPHAATATTAVVDIAEDEPHPEGRVEQAAMRISAGGAGNGNGGPPTLPRRGGHLKRAAASYFSKMRGGLDHPPPVPRFPDLIWSFVGAFCAILAVSGLDSALWGLPSMARSYDTSAAAAAIAPNQHPLGALPVLVASFGASAVLLFGVPESKLSQPRGCIGGHALSAVVGVLVRLALGPEVGAHAPPYVVAALGMALALTAMQLTRTPHPPGGATALIACTAPGVAEPSAWFGARFVIAVAVGSCVMTLVAVLVNNLAADRAYPTYWWWGSGGPPKWCSWWRRRGSAGAQQAAAAPPKAAPARP